MNPFTGTPTERAIPSLSRRTWVLIMAMLVGATSYMDRQILTMLVEPIRREFDLTDQQLGLLTGLAFAMIYTITAIPAARLADRWSRRGVVSIAVATWSVMTMVCGLATNFWQLFLARVGVGFGEAGGSAPMQALLADYFPRRQRGTALSIYLLGAPIGMGLGLAFAGWSVVEYGWRWTFILAGIPGLLIAPLLILTVKEVRAGMADGISQKFDQPPFGKTIAALWQIRSLPLMMLAATLMALIGMRGCRRFSSARMASPRSRLEPSLALHWQRVRSSAISAVGHWRIFSGARTCVGICGHRSSLVRWP